MHNEEGLRVKLIISKLLKSPDHVILLSCLAPHPGIVEWADTVTEKLSCPCLAGGVTSFSNVYLVRLQCLLAFRHTKFTFQDGEDGAAGEDGAGPPTRCLLSEEEGAEAGIPVLP